MAPRKKRKTAAKKAKRKTAKKATKRLSAKKTVSRIRQPLTKSELFGLIAERAELSKKQVSVVFDELGTIIHSHIQKGAAGEFKLPGLLKMKVKATKAKKARKGINPFTGEPTTFKAKPASRKVKITALKNLKEMATS